MVGTAPSTNFTMYGLCDCDPYCDCRRCSFGASDEVMRAALASLEAVEHTLDIIHDLGA